MKENEGVDRGWRGGCETEICTNLRLLVMSGDKLLRREGEKDWQEEKRYGKRGWRGEKKGHERWEQAERKMEKCGRRKGGWVRL